MATGAAIAAALTCLPIAYFLEAPLQFNVSAVPTAAMVLLGIFHTALAALIYFRVIRNLGAVTFAQINYLIPVLGSVWGVIILGEALGWRNYCRAVSGADRHLFYPAS